jgi:predicted nucleotidyltransferase
MKNLLIKENYGSQNLFEKVNMLTEEQIRAISKGLEWTANNFPNAVLVGGGATIYYITGARDLTPDLDFMVHDINSIKTKLSLQDIPFRNLDVGFEYALGITIDSFNTDYLNSQVGNIKLNNLILQTPINGMVGGYELKIINPELLAIMKLNLGREKDINDGFKLLSSGKVDRNKFKSYLYQLKDSLEDYESIIMYKNLIP